MPFSGPMPRRPIRICAVQDNATPSEAAFAAALLDPAAALPQAVKRGGQRRYAVYRNNVTVGLVRALEANFPAIRRLLGETYFTGLARTFAQAHPPASPLLFHYGEDFADVLAAEDDLAGYPYLADVARLEHLWRRAHHARDAKVLEPNSLSALDPETLMASRLRPHPACALLSSSYAVHAIFTASRGEGDAVPDAAQAQCVLLTRPRFDVEVRVISPETHAFLQALAARATLAEAAEQGFAANPRFDLAAAIRLMVEAGAFQHKITQDPS